MAQPFISYYEHLAKLAQVANKQTMFLAHILHNMEFNKDNKQFFIDMSTYRKISIMKEISPNIEEDKLLNLANQYLSKLKKAEFIRNISRGMWLVNPSCYGQYRVISKNLRMENTKIFTLATFDKDGLISAETYTEDEDNFQEPFKVDIEQ